MEPITRRVTAEEGLLPREPIAIIGMGCRFAGAPNVASFWRALRNGTETAGDYPGNRLPYIDDVYATGTGIATHRGGFLHNIDRFDAQFFGIAPREAALLDPQQRLLLEVAWQAIEDAGIPTEQIAGSQTGVFIGLWNSDYESCLYEQDDGLDFYATTGGGRYPASGRLAYFFDLRGPNLVVDTACSSSLVAIHLACQSLCHGESEMALAGGANVILRPEITLTYSAAKMLSPDGRSKFGDASADGYVRSEGAGLILLKPLSKALVAGDPIYAVIRGSVVNNDGRSSGLLISPSRAGQEALLRGAFRNARVDPGEIDYIEAHGTGTLVGDPVEIETIGRVVGTDTRRRSCAIGSVKTNIGHTESAAGVAGIIKVALSLEHGIIPASLHFREPNPSIAWSEIPVAVQRVTAPWPDAGTVRLAGVSGFGITGTNAHIVLENSSATSSNTVDEGDNHLFLLSAHSPKALEIVATSWCDRLRDDPQWPSSLTDLAYTAAVRRTHQEFRLSINASSRAELEDRLSAWLKQGGGGGGTGQRLGTERPKTVFVFPGQGGQWTGMARGLMGNAVFRDALIRCDEAIHKHVGWSVKECLLAPSGPPIHDIDVVQPTLFTVMVALAAVWRSWGIEPDAVIGHSMGECAAAAVSGALSIEDAAAVICHRSSLMKGASGRGLMAVAELPMEDAAILADEYQGHISIAANNSPTSIVFSGDPDAIEDVIRRLGAGEVFCRRIKVDVASHCAHMEPFQTELTRRLREIRPRTGSVLLYSTTSGQTEDGSGLDAEYWSRNLRQPVLFSSGIQTLLREGFNTFIEINSHPVLLQAIEDGIRHSGRQAIAVGSLRRDQPESVEMLNALGTLHVSGFPVDFSKLYTKGVCLRLPAYSWQGERHWINTGSSSRRPGATPPSIATDCTNDIYELRWFEQELPPATTKAAGLWILLSSNDDATATLSSSLQAFSDECICVSEVEQLQRLIESSGGCCRGVIRLSDTRGASGQDAAAEALDIVRTVQAMTGAAVASPPRLYLLSTGVWHLASDSAEISVAQSPAWGLGRVITREHAELRCVNVDLSATPTVTEIETAASLLRSDGPEEQIAVRGGKYYAARYERVIPVKRPDTPHFQTDATYLVTGGLGGIGLNVAMWMTNLGARHIALVGRTGPNETACEQIKAIEASGASVRVFRADVADEVQVTALLQQIKTEMPALKGVFHLAATIDATLLRDINAENLDRVMRPKVAGGWALHRHLETAKLEFFVLFSSITAALSQPGLGSYAVANAYLDALARYRCANGLVAQSIQWNEWHSTGLVNGETAQRGAQSYRRMGVRALSIEGALKGLERIMVLDVPEVMVFPATWEQFGRSFADDEPPRAFLRLLPQNPEPVKDGAESIREKLLGLEAGMQRRNALESHLRDKLAVILKLDAARIDSVKPFGSMGLDSLMALEFVRRLAITTSLRLPATAVFNYPTIRTLAQEIAKRMGIPLDIAGFVTQSAAACEIKVELPVSTVAALTEEEAINLLMGKSTVQE